MGADVQALNYYYVVYEESRYTGKPPGDAHKTIFSGENLYVARLRANQYFDERDLFLKNQIALLPVTDGYSLTLVLVVTHSGGSYDEFYLKGPLEAIMEEDKWIEAEIFLEIASLN